VLEDINVFAHPLLAVVGMHAGKGIRGIGKDGRAIQIRHFEEAFAQERKVSAL